MNGNKHLKKRLQGASGKKKKEAEGKERNSGARSKKKNGKEENEYVDKSK